MGVVIYYLMCGNPPFFEATQKDTREAIKIGKYNQMTGELWSSISREAKEFVAELLLVDPGKRMSAADALKHRWVNPREANTNGVTATCEACNRSGAFVFKMAPDLSIPCTVCNGKGRVNVVGANKLQSAMTRGVSERFLRGVENFAMRTTRFQRAIIALMIQKVDRLSFRNGMFEPFMRQLEAALQALDANFDGKLSKEELSDAFLRVGMRKDHIDNDVFPKLDIDGDGFLHYREFLVAGAGLLILRNPRYNFLEFNIFF